MKKFDYEGVFSAIAADAAIEYSNQNEIQLSDKEPKIMFTTNTTASDDLYLAMKNAPIKPPKKNKKPEKDEQSEVAKIFVADGWEVIQYSSGRFEMPHGGWFTANRNYNTGATAGHPDLRASKNGISIAIECKKPKGGVVSEKQKLYRENSAKYGNMTIICRTKESAKEFITINYNLDSVRDAVNWYMENYKQ